MLWKFGRVHQIWFLCRSHSMNRFFSKNRKTKWVTNSPSDMKIKYGEKHKSKKKDTQLHSLSIRTKNTHSIDIIVIIDSKKKPPTYQFHRFQYGWPVFLGCRGSTTKCVFSRWISLFSVSRHVQMWYFYKCDQ